MNPRRAATATALAATAALVLAAQASGGPVAAAPPNQEKPTMSQAPSSSRPAPAAVAPVEHDGVRYVQDSFDERQGDQAGGYLAALDARTGARLWRVQVYPVAAPPAGLPAMPRLFRKLQLAADGKALEVENEAGGVYRVDLASRAVTQLSGPPASAEAQAPAKPKPKP